MKITEIYKKFGLPPNLEEHMARVFAVVSIIQKHWKGGLVDWDMAKKMALVHDIGNVVKMDNKNHPEFLGSEQKNIEYWNQKQVEMIAKYGEDENEATKLMLIELGIDPKIVEDVYNKRFVNSIHTSQSNNVSLKILYYADLRALPLRIGTLTERIEDIRKRYLNYTSRADFEDLVNACYEIEKLIQTNLDFDLNDINDELVNSGILSNKNLIGNMEI